MLEFLFGADPLDLALWGLRFADTFFTNVPLRIKLCTYYFSDAHLIKLRIKILYLQLRTSILWLLFCVFHCVHTDFPRNV